MSATPCRDYFVGVVQKDPRYKSQDLQSSLTLLEPVTRALAVRVRDLANESDHLSRRWEVYETLRNPSRQLALFKQGKTKRRTVGCHRFALAFDLVWRDSRGRWSWEGDYGFLSEIARSVGLN